MARQSDSPYDPMYHELTTLLPRPRRRALLREYFFRLATVGVLALVGVIFIHGVLLVPVSVYLQHQVGQQQELLTASTKTSSADEQAANDRLKKLQNDATYLTHLSTTQTVSGLIRAVLKVPRTGITLSGFSFSPASGTEPTRFLLLGMAATRDDLRRYDVALAALPFVTNADLPISAYAKETSIPFTITLTGSLLP